MDYKKLQEKIDAIWKNESIEEAQSPAQKAAFQKMLDDKKGDKPEAVEVEVDETVETTTTPERYGQDFFRSVLDELDQNDAPGQAPAGTADQPGSMGPRDVGPRDANKLPPDQKKRRRSRISQDLAKLRAEKAKEEQATVSEATQGPGVDAVMELIDMGVSKEDLFDQMMRDHSDDELMSFADDYRRTNDLLGNEGDDSIDIDPDQDDSNVFQQSNY